MSRKIDLFDIECAFPRKNDIDITDDGYFRTVGDKPRNGLFYRFVANSWDTEERLNELRNEFESLVQEYNNVRVHEGTAYHRYSPSSIRVCWTVFVFARGFRKKSEQLANHTYRITR